MSFKDLEITNEELSNVGVINLPDKPGLSASEMQEKFEETARSVIIPHFNELTKKLEEPEAAASIGCKVDTGLTANENVQSVLTALNSQKEGKLTNTIVKPLVENTDSVPVIDGTTGRTMRTGIINLVNAVVAKIPFATTTSDGIMSKEQVTTLENMKEANHSHSNKDQLDKIGENEDGNMTYDGKPIVVEIPDATEENKGLMTPEHIERIEDVEESAHTHTNKDVIDKLAAGEYNTLKYGNKYIQYQLIAGEGIDIDGNNVISATGGGKETGQGFIYDENEGKWRFTKSANVEIESKESLLELRSKYGANVTFENEEEEEELADFLVITSNKNTLEFTRIGNGVHTSGEVEDKDGTLSEVRENAEKKQDKLTAGTGIKIEKNVISVTGGGGGGEDARVTEAIENGYIGKNLVDLAYFEQGSISSTDGTNTPSTTNGRCSNYIKVEPNTTYTFSGDLSALSRVDFSSIRLSEYSTNSPSGHIKRNEAVDTKITITTTENTRYLRWSFNYDTTSSVTYSLAENVKLMLERGDTRTEYQPYAKSNVELTEIINGDKLPINEIVDGYYVKGTDGSFVAYSGWSRTGYIDVSNASTLEIVSPASTGSNAFYDENYNYISMVGSLVTGYNLVYVPIQAKYMALSSPSNIIRNYIVTLQGYAKSIRVTNKELPLKIYGTSDEWKSKSSWAKGEICIDDNKLWKCLVSNSNKPSEGSEWTQISLKKLFEYTQGTVNIDINYISSLAINNVSKTGNTVIMTIVGYAKPIAKGSSQIVATFNSGFIPVDKFNSLAICDDGTRLVVEVNDNYIRFAPISGNLVEGTVFRITMTYIAQ